jgi:Cytochrome P450
MKDEPCSGGGTPPPSKLRAWGNALAITLLGCLLAGLGCFVLLANYLWQLIDAQQLDLCHAAAWWEVGFTVAMAVILGVIVVWQRARGSSLAELGWGRPTTPLAIVLAVLLGVAFLGSCYFGARSILRGVDVLELNWLRVALVPLGIFLAIGEETIMRGEIVFAAIGSANRDERQFANPDALDITREPNKHLAFGLGAHYCLGAPLARLEGQIAINTLLRRTAQLRPAAAPEALRWRRGLVLRGLEALPVTFVKRA